MGQRKKTREKNAKQQLGRSNACQYLAESFAARGMTTCPLELLR